MNENILMFIIFLVGIAVGGAAQSIQVSNDYNECVQEYSLLKQSCFDE